MRRAALCWLLWFSLAAPALAQSGQLGGATYRVPPGWSAAAGNGELRLSPSAAPGVRVRLSAPQPLRGTLEAWFTAFVRASVGELPGAALGEVQSDTSDEGDRVLAQAAVGGGGAGPVRFYAATTRAGQVLGVVYEAPTLDLFSQYQPGLEAFLDSLELKGTAPQAKTPPSPALTPPAKAPTTPPSTKPPATSSPGGAALPTVPAVPTARFVASGKDPDKEPIPDEFRCYPELKGSDFAKPALVVQILEGRQYRVGVDGKSLGTGAFVPVHDTLEKVRWTSGPLAGTDDAYLNFGDHGQKINLQNVGPEDKEIDFECYQRGPREDMARLTFGLRTPKVGKYACAAVNDSRPAATFEVLAGNRYRYGGGEGQYRVDLLSDQDDDWADVDFTGGPLDDQSGTYEEENGKRTLSVSRTAECSAVVKPTPLPRFGKAKAPAPPAGSGGLSGAYASWQVDVGGFCGGLCWNFYVFDKNGYVYTDEPDEGLEDADCTRTHPNGLPVCEVYAYKNGQLKIGGDKPQPLKKEPDGDLNLDGTTLIAIRPVTGQKLSGTYRYFSASVAVGGLSSSFSEAFLRFSPDGRFAREASGGFSATFTDTGNSLGNTTGGATATSNRSSGGTYRFVGNTLELRSADGHVVRQFAFLPDKDKTGKPSTGMVRADGRSYTLQDGK